MAYSKNKHDDGMPSWLKDELATDVPSYAQLECNDIDSGSNQSNDIESALLTKPKEIQKQDVRIWTFGEVAIFLFRSGLLVSHVANMSITINFAINIPTCCGDKSTYTDSLIIFGVVGLLVTFANIGIVYRDSLHGKLSFLHYVLGTIYEIILSISLFLRPPGLISDTSLGFTMFSCVFLYVTTTIMESFIKDKLIDHGCSNYCYKFCCYTGAYFITQIGMFMSMYTFGYCIYSFFLSPDLYFFTTNMYYQNTASTQGFVWFGRTSTQHGPVHIFNRCTSNYNLSSVTHPSIGGTVFEYHTYNSNISNYDGDGCCYWKN